MVNAEPRECDLQNCVSVSSNSISANVSHLSFPVGEFGLNLMRTAHWYEEYQHSARRILRTSTKQGPRKIFRLYSTRPAMSGDIVNGSISSNTDGHQFKVTGHATEVKQATRDERL